MISVYDRRAEVANNLTAHFTGVERCGWPRCAQKFGSVRATLQIASTTIFLCFNYISSTLDDFLQTSVTLMFKKYFNDLPILQAGSKNGPFL